jgi:hypothetical protein
MAPLNEIIWTKTCELAPPDKVRVQFLTPSGCKPFKYILHLGCRLSEPDPVLEAERAESADELTDPDPPPPHWISNENTVAYTDKQVAYWAFQPETAPDGGAIR